MAGQTNAKLAVLVDADNAQASLSKELFAEMSRYGTATIKRAYGDWTTTNLTRWKEVLHPLAIQPIQQFNNTKGKNSTDSALIIDAMDILHAQSVDGFCIVSSDSDFTRLATRIRESGRVVYGFGRRDTPVAFQAACDKFIYTEILQSETSQPQPAEKAVEAFAFPALQPMVEAAIEATARDDGWASMSAVGAQMNRTTPSFDARNYGFKKLTELMRKQAYVELKEQAVMDGSGHPQVRLKIRG